MSPSSSFSPSAPPLPALVGVIHLAPLPGSPRYGGRRGDAARAAAEDARALERAGFDAVMVENFGDAPFFPGEVPPVTVAAMTECALAVRAAAPGLELGVNVLRNDARAALAVALVAGASFVRINVHIGARVTDQGVIEGRAHETLRLRRELAAEGVRLFCDADVKHSAALAPRPLTEELAELVGRGLADAVLITGAGTGARVAPEHLAAATAAAPGVPLFVASGAIAAELDDLRAAHGVVVGSALRRSGRAGDPIDPDLARSFAEAFRASRAPEA